MSTSSKPLFHLNPPFKSVSQEVLDLAKHHLEILDRNFHHRCTLSDSPELGQEPKAFISVEMVFTRDSYAYEHMTILVASFSSDSVDIVTPAYTHPLSGSETIYYADPRFTDDFLSDKLREVMLRKPHLVRDPDRRLRERHL